MGSTSGGLRARHRQQVLVDLHEAAVLLVGHVGFSDATIDLIADRAGVSRRTFFNYYASKEDAVLGATPPTASDQALSEFADGRHADQFTRTVRLIVAIVRSTFVAGTVIEERRGLIDRYPQLRERMAQHVAAAETLTETALGERLAGSDSQPRSAESSRALLMLAGTVLRYAYATDPHAFESADSIAVETAISVFRNALREIS
ncbi:TetR/AcrR family transcriptional regulator [Mycobacterium sp. DBP42]|uniref:TetR/AcrR family transcriptional regulator n=1 Tax=Mycobacterium sp. DBP42 TaxID=2545267 RepID=UPI001486D332|nr:TetR/AcrR family transcriptional regulator [Mycobacterium sp. DBP42]